MPPTEKPKYSPDLIKINLNNRRELLGEGVKARNNICLFHKYPHLAPPIDSIAQTVSVPYVTAVVSTDYSSLYEDPTDRLNALDERLLMELIREYLTGPCVTFSVQKKVQAYLLHLFEADRHFRQQVLGGVPRSDALKFSAKLFAEISRLLAPKVAEDGKVTRIPVHQAVEEACAFIAQ